MRIGCWESGRPPKAPNEPKDVLLILRRQLGETTQGLGASGRGHRRGHLPTVNCRGALGQPWSLRCVARREMYRTSGPLFKG